MFSLEDVHKNNLLWGVIFFLSFPKRLFKRKQCYKLQIPMQLTKEKKESITLSSKMKTQNINQSIHSWTIMSIYFKSHRNMQILFYRKNVSFPSKTWQKGLGAYQYGTNHSLYNVVCTREKTHGACQVLSLYWDYSKKKNKWPFK